MSETNVAGVDSLCSLQIVHRDHDSAGAIRLICRVSQGRLPDRLRYCLIGLKGSWLWFDEFQLLDDPALVRIPADNASLDERDETLYLLPTEFQPPLSFRLLDRTVHGVLKKFKPAPAGRARILGTDGKYWIRLRPIEHGRELEPGETLEPEGWDHEHCDLCNKHITAGDTFFFFAWGEGGSYLCEFCNARFAKPHCIREVIYPGNGERADEQD